LELKTVIVAMKNQYNEMKQSQFEASMEQSQFEASILCINCIAAIFAMKN